MNKKRKPNRLTDYDYTQNGAYFITICVNDRKPILSSITGRNAFAFQKLELLSKMKQTK